MALLDPERFGYESGVALAPDVVEILHQALDVGVAHSRDRKFS
jgi:hypothetical protein